MDSAVQWAVRNRDDVLERVRACRRIRRLEGELGRIQMSFGVRLCRLRAHEWVSDVPSAAYSASYSRQVTRRSPRNVQNLVALGSGFSAHHFGCLGGDIPLPQRKTAADVISPFHRKSATFHRPGRRYGGGM